MIKDTKKTTKKIIKNDAEAEAAILGETIPDKISKNVDYESPKRQYKVTTLSTGLSMTVPGNLVETFIGETNKKARNELRNGAAEVITTEKLSNKEMYKIEVIE